jgi:hypothetical protein
MQGVAKTCRFALAALLLAACAHRPPVEPDSIEAFLKAGSDTVDPPARSDRALLPAIGIGGSEAVSRPATPLPHHRTCGAASGGSVG